MYRTEKDDTRSHMPRELQDSRVKPIAEGDGRFWDHCERGEIVVWNEPALSRWWGGTNLLIRRRYSRTSATPNLIDDGTGPGLCTLARTVTP